MTKKSLLIPALLLAAITSAARADWPAKLFAPNAYIPQESGQLMRYYDATGQKYYMLAYMNDPQDVPGWDNNHPISSGYAAQQIADIRAKGGDVIVSFGGESGSREGRETAMVETDPVKLQAKYQSVIDAYKLTWLDMDIEGLDMQDPTINVRRNTALVGLQKANPGLIIDFSLPANPDGVNAIGLEALRNAKSQGLKVAVVNILAVNFGDKFDKLGETMGQLTVDTAKKAYEQCKAIDPDIKIGISPNLGVFDTPPEVFTLEDAKITMKFAQETPWVSLLSFWEVGRDNGSNGVTGEGGALPAPRRGGAASRRGGAGTRRGGGAGGGGGRGRAAATVPAAPVSNLAVAGNGVPIAPPFAYTDLFKTFTTGFTPAQP